MEIICIGQDNWHGITPGKIYDTRSNLSLSSMVSIKNNDGVEMWYPSELFISLADWRESQLDILLS